jgi:hypothetical protein
VLTSALGSRGSESAKQDSRRTGLTERDLKEDDQIGAPLPAFRRLAGLEVACRPAWRRAVYKLFSPSVTVVVTLAHMAVAGVAAAVTVQPPATPRIFDVTPAHGVVAGKPVGPSDVFTPDQNPIYVWFRHEGCVAGTTIASDWYYLGSQPPLHITEGRATVDASANSGQFNLELAPGNRWPLGDYRGALRGDGRPAAAARFRVVESAPRHEPPLYVHPRTGYQFAPPAGWTLDDRVSPADVQLTRADGNGLIEITSGLTTVRLDPVSYAAGWESKSVGAGQLLVAKRAGRALNLNGEMAYEAV